MDDPFGCLQGVKISSKIIQEILQKRNELHLCLLSIWINRCPSCKEQLVYVVNEFCRNVQNVVECLNVMMMNSSKKKTGEEVPLRLQRLMFI